MKFVAAAAALAALAACASVAHAERDLCAAYSHDCMRCAQHPDCGFCGDGEYAPEEAVEAGAHVGGWIFRQRGLEGADDGEDIQGSVAAAEAHRESIASHLAASRAATAAAMADASLLVQQLAPAARKAQHQHDASAAAADTASSSSSFVELGASRAGAGAGMPHDWADPAARAHEMEAAAAATGSVHAPGLVHSAAAGKPIRHLPSEEHAATAALADSGHAATAAAGGGGLVRESAPLARSYQQQQQAQHHPSSLHRRRPLLGCYNKTRMIARMTAYATALHEAATAPGAATAASLPAFAHHETEGPMCVDFRTDACDCAGADSSLQRCAAVVQEVRTPVFLIVSALLLAVSLVGAVVAVQLSYGRCWKRHGDEEHHGAAGTMLRKVGASSGSSSKATKAVPAVAAASDASAVEGVAAR